MKLTDLKQHFTKDKNKNWKPKRSFDSVEDIQKLTGFKLDKITIYQCDFCNKYHMTSWKF